MHFFRVFCLSFLFAAWLLISYAHAETEQTIEGKIIQIARETVYVNLGRKDGVAAGQILQVMRDHREIGRLHVVRLADGFCACEVAAKTGAIRADDRVVGLVTIPERTETEPDSIATSPESRVSTSDVTPLPDRETDLERQTRFYGKVALRYSFTDDQSDMNRDTRQPAVVASVNAEQIEGTPLAFSLRMRARSYHVNGRQKSLGSHPGFRLYDLALTFDSDRTRYGFGFGRLNPGAIAGVGEFDGALLTARLGPGLQAGVFGGFQPDFTTSAFETQVSKTGAFLNFTHSRGSDVTQQGTIAFAGQYCGGAVEREFLYVQHILRVGRHLYAYQQAEVDLDRTDRSAQMKKLQLTNAFLSLRYSPSRVWSLGVAYDARNYLPLSVEDAVVDSLLDTAFRQGWRADIRFRPHRRFFMYARGNVRLRKGEQSTRAFASGATITRLPGLGTTCRARFTLVDGTHNRATDLSFGVGRNLGHLLYADVDWGRYRSHLLASDTWHTRNRLSTSLQVYLPGRSFFLLSHDLYRGEMDYAHTFIELGMRF